MSTEETPANVEQGWDRAALRAPHRRLDKAARVRSMFNAIAPTYEWINRLATAGRDAVWRRRAVAAANLRAGDVVLDVACGTGDMIRAFAQAQPPPTRIIGVDFARQMLARGDYHGVAMPLELIEADALHLPLPDACVDVATCAFGVRNFQDVAAGLREMHRVLRAGGRVVILEFASPENRVLRWAYEAYCRVVLPSLGWLIAGDRVGAYRYLPRSVETFDTPATVLGLLRGVGFERLTAERMHFGGVVLYRGEKVGCHAERSEVSCHPDGDSSLRSD